MIKQVLWLLTGAVLIVGLSPAQEKTVGNAHPTSAAALLSAAFQIPARQVQHFAIQEGLPLKMPTDVAVDRDGRLYVADGVNHRVVCFAPSGDVVESIIGFADVSFSRPLCVSIGPLPFAGETPAVRQQDVWISDSGTHEVYRLDPNLTAGQIIRPPPGPDGDPADPADLAVTPEGRQLYLVDNDHHRLLVYTIPTSQKEKVGSAHPTQKGAEAAPYAEAGAAGLWESLGSKGQSLGQFEWPFMMACNRDGYLFITEAVGARVQRLSPQRRWAGQIGGWGVAPGQFYRPKGIAIDRADRIYVGDSTLGVVQVFSTAGRLQGVLTENDGSPMKFAHPMGLCFDENGFLYVVEMMNHRIVKVAVP